MAKRNSQAESGHISLYWGKAKDQVRRRSEGQQTGTCVLSLDVFQNIFPWGTVNRRNNIQGPENVQNWARAFGVQQGSCLLCTLLFGFDSPASPMVPQAPEIMIPVHRDRTKLRETPVVVNTRKRLRVETVLIQSIMTPETVPSTGIYPGPQEQTAWTLSPHSLVTGSASSTITERPTVGGHEGTLIYTWTWGAGRQRLGRTFL